jgi:hypothetical protein
MRLFDSFVSCVNSGVYSEKFFNLNLLSVPIFVIVIHTLFKVSLFFRIKPIQMFAKLG